MASSEKKIMPKEINHLKEIFKRNYSGFDIYHVKRSINVWSFLVKIQRFRAIQGLCLGFLKLSFAKQRDRNDAS